MSQYFQEQNGKLNATSWQIYKKKQVIYTASSTFPKIFINDSGAFTYVYNSFTLLPPRRGA